MNNKPPQPPPLTQKQQNRKDAIDKLTEALNPMERDPILRTFISTIQLIILYATDLNRWESQRKLDDMLDRKLHRFR